MVHELQQELVHATNIEHRTVEAQDISSRIYPVKKKKLKRAFIISGYKVQTEEAINVPDKLRS